jgi:hypothetical protein
LFALYVNCIVIYVISMYCEYANESMSFASPKT